MLRRALLALALLTATAHADMEVVPTPVAPPPTTWIDWQAYGFLRLVGSVIQDDPTTLYIGRNDGFELQNARIGLGGTYHAGWGFLAWQLSIDGAIDARSDINTTNGRLTVGLKDAYADVGLARAFVIRAGRFETIFDVDDMLYEPDRSFVDRSLESQGVLATQGFEKAGFAPGRSEGVAVRGDVGDHLTYEVAVQDGAGEFASQNDNDTPAFSAALLAHFYNAKSFAYVAGRYDSFIDGDLPGRQTENDLLGSVGARLTGEGYVPIAEAELVVRHRTFPTLATAAENAYGAHAQLVERLFWTHALEVFAGYRFAIFEPSDLIATDQVQEHTVGATLGFRRVPIRLMLNYTHPIEQTPLVNDRFEALFEVSLAGGGTWADPHFSSP